VTGRPAVFLDRDGTIIRDTAYVRDPDDVELLPGAAAAIRRLNERSLPVIVVTNQSGIARGLLTEQDYERVRMRLDTLLAAEGARIDASYHCPHHPDFSGPCECRKPRLKLYRRAAVDHGLDLARSFYVGDRKRDVEPMLNLYGQGILIRCESTPPEDRPAAGRTSIEIPEEDGPDLVIDVVDSLPAAVDLILAAAANS
jgi:D-glycero-D-manno-heptose 1,7-bisphosphate phosphatase